MNSLRPTSRRPIYAGCFIALLTLTTAFRGHSAISITGFGPSVWPRSDASLGVSGYVIENFEDTTLSPGLTVKVQSPSLGSYGPVSTLPFIFSGSLAEDAGGVFNSSLMWDGTHGLLNRPSIPIPTYGNDGGWSDVFFLFSGGVTSLGFSYAQAEANIVISVDLGSGYVFLANSADLLGGSSGRNGYLRMDAGGGETIYGIKLDNQNGDGDGMIYDHLAYQPAAVPEPSTYIAGALLFLPFGAHLIRRLRTRN
jgi:hypothetical protein